MVNSGIWTQIRTSKKKKGLIPLKFLYSSSKFDCCVINFCFPPQHSYLTASYSRCHVNHQEVENHQLKRSVTWLPISWPSSRHPSILRWWWKNTQSSMMNRWILCYDKSWFVSIGWLWWLERRCRTYRKLSRYVLCFKLAKFLWSDRKVTSSIPLCEVFVSNLKLCCKL